MFDSLRRLEQLERNLDRWLPRKSASTEDWPASLLDFVPALTPRWERPVHLGRIAEAFERATREETRLCISVPPQHGKTELIKHGLIWLLQRRPELRHAYVTYETHRAYRISRQCRELASRAGIQTEGAQDQWRTPSGGSVAATGIGGPLTGEPIDGVLLVDDPHKNRQEAESPTIRQHVRDWYNSTAETRMHPGASVIVVHTRWHPDDLIGQFAKEGWEVINLPALSDEGQALWPGQRPLEFLEQKRKRIGEYEWAALYQGQPRPRGGALFGEPHYYDALPASGYRVGYGVDLAYTAKTHADYSVCIRLFAVGDAIYVTEVQRKQVDAPAFALTLKAMHSAFPGRMLWHCSGTEKGAAQFIQQRLPSLQTEQTTADKFVRAQPVAAAWNAGKVMVPHSAPWLAAFLDEVCSFTGVGDIHDDQVDALASGFALLSVAEVKGQKWTMGSRRL